MLVGGIRPHLFCLPILKRNRHQTALIEAATSGDRRFFLGTDSAPHPRHAKENACGCAGCYSHHAAIELYAEAFDRAGALHQLEGFASRYGADFYNLAYNRHTITLNRDPWTVPERIDYDGGELIPLAAGQALNWRLQN
jgi:dihydroorotase